MQNRTRWLRGALIELWSDANVQNELDGVQRNRTIYEKIAKEMEKLGWKQCRTKVKILAQRYRKVIRQFYLNQVFSNIKL